LQRAISLLKESKTAMQVTIATIGQRRLYVDRMVLLLAAALLVGCGFHSGPPVAHLKGKVTIGGKPVPGDANARIIFGIPPSSAHEAKPAIANIVNGEYDAPKVAVGHITAIFDIQLDTGREFARGMKESKNLVPPEHQSGIAITVAEGTQTQDFDL
jgi:hypothetical protein